MYRIPKRRGATTFYVVETQKSRQGKDRTSGEDTPPYRFGEFDVLAVSMEPATGDWNQFRFTVGNWLIPRPAQPALMAVYQPVSPKPNDDWTDSLTTAIDWWRSKRRKTISGEPTSDPPA